VQEWEVTMQSGQMTLRETIWSCHEVLNISITSSGDDAGEWCEQEDKHHVQSMIVDKVTLMSISTCSQWTWLKHSHIEHELYAPSMAICTRHRTAKYNKETVL
jgi:hypothetical protein